MQTSDQVGESSTDETQGTWTSDQNVPTAAAANEPIIITGGSVEIDLNDTTFPQEPGNPNRRKNPNKKLRRLVITDRASTPNELLTVDLQALANGRCRIVVEYD